MIMQGVAGDPAIGAPGRRPLTYGELQDLATDTVGRLNELGIGRNDRVAIVLPNGPEMAAAFVVDRRRRHDRAAQPRLPGGRVRVLPDRPRRQGAPGRRGRQCGGRSGGGAARRPDPAHRDGRRRAGRRLPHRGRGDRRDERAGPCGARRHRAGAAHLRHDVAPENRAADAGQPRRPRRRTSARRCGSRTRTAASTSCRCSTSTA